MTDSVQGGGMETARVLLVDDDEVIRYTLTRLLADHGFEVTTAANVPEALKNITSREFDVLLSDLHMPGPADGLTVVSAMRHANPRAVTLLLSAFPEMGKATDALLLQADEIIVKPFNTQSLIETIKQRLTGAPITPRRTESVATLLERDMEKTILRWFDSVAKSQSLMKIAITFEQRSAYLSRILIDLVARLRSHEPLGTYRSSSRASTEHGADRYRQGYTAAMVVEESRFLQVSIFETLQINLIFVDFSVVLLDVMVIADEIDSQLSQMMVGYEAEATAAA